jgi:hypothetical protein
MPYRPEAPPDKEVFPGTGDLSGGLPFPKNAGYSGYTGYRLSAVDLVINDASVVAILIDSTILGTSIWFVLRDNWRPNPGDSTPVFYASELPYLRSKTPQELRSIFNVRTAGMVRQ